jgi:hemolysin activation/secretion protein
VHLNLDITQTENLGHGFVAAQHVLGQVSDQPLVSSEEFAAGGLTSVRGYLLSEAIGDDGVSGGVEVRSPSLAPRLGRFVDDLRVYVFGDGAALWPLDPLHEQTHFFPLASAGFGLRIALLRYLKGDVALAMPLISGAATHADRPRATFSLKSEF